MAVVEKGRRRPEEDHPTADKPAVKAGDSAAGGPPRYTSGTRNRPILQSLRDNFYALFRSKYRR